MRNLDTSHGGRAAFHKSRWAAGLAAVSAALAGCAAEPVADQGEKFLYAERVYDNYEQAASGAITFDLATLQSGSVAEIADIPVGDLLGVPDSWLRMTPRGTEITSIVREARDPALDEWQDTIDLHTFEQMGRPLDGAIYRLLSVSSALDGTTFSHQALEICWTDDAHCIVMDPVVLQADAYLHDRQRMLAEGWAPQKSAAKADVGISAVCSLNSSPQHVGISITHPAWWVEYKNVFGIVLVRKDMGEQRMGISCFVNGAGACVSSGFGHSNTSSCFANLGYTCDCENTGNLVGISADGSTTKAWSETRCAHRAFLSAAVSFNVDGTGANLNVNWDTAGSVDTNGGQIFDSCSFH